MKVRTNNNPIGYYIQNYSLSLNLYRDNESN